MVLEQLFKARWLERKQHAFYLGLLYSLIGIVSARMVFGADTGLASVALTSLLILPSLAKLFSIEENQARRHKLVSIRRLWQDHADIFQTYLSLFMGVFVTYFIVTILISTPSSFTYFDAQMDTAGIHGFATASGYFFDLVSNNLLVFVVVFALSLIYGAGAVFFITWNASVWGVAIAHFVKLSSTGTVTGTLSQLFPTLLPFLPHLVTEAVAYISAAIGGGILSKAVIREKIGSKKFRLIVADAVVFLILGFLLLVIAAYIEAYVF